MSVTPESQTVPAPEWIELDRYVEAFENARSVKPDADLADFLPPPQHPLYLSVLRELVCVDLELRWGERSPSPLEDYRTRFPRLFESSEHLDAVVRQDFRLRSAAGETPSSEDYRNRYGIVLDEHSNIDGSGTIDAAWQDASRIGRASLRSGTTHNEPSDVRSLLHRRLRFIGIAVSTLFAYLAVLGLINPDEKVGLFLEHAPVIAVNWLVLVASLSLTAVLWKKRNLRLTKLRLIEIALFGMALIELSLGLLFDLFVDHELLQPLSEGDHALFHYASSWSLPFFALIVAYGTLVPSTWRRCLVVVVVMAIPLLALSCLAGANEHALSQSFLQSYILQAVFWMGGAIAIASYGAHRLEMLRHEAFEARRLGQYVLRRRIGTGGMGEVYLAEHSLLRRPCAIKVIRPEMARDRQSLRRFQLEVQATATLTHPNTIQIFDYGETKEGNFYYVMEYLPGVDLKQLVASAGPLTPTRVVHVLRQVCGALAEAHSIGLVHRDVQPRNIILCERGGIKDVAKLLDFGLVYAIDTRSSDGNILAGTPDYMSPEQASGREHVDGRSDIYSMGAVAYFLLTGKPPFVKNSLQGTLTAHRDELVTPPSQLRPGIPDELETIVLRCLEKNPPKRFTSMADLNGALASCEAASRRPEDASRPERTC